jgi:hypothetical protein
MYTKKVASLFNSRLINEVCKDIDNGHSLSKTLKGWLVETLIPNSVDLSIPAHKHYLDAYNFVKEDMEN